MPDFITVLRAVPSEGMLAKKVLSLDPLQVRDYGSATYFDTSPRPTPVAGLGDLARVLLQIAGDSRAAVIRGRRLIHQHTMLRRVSLARPDYPAIFGSASHQWAALDVDSLPCPPDLDRSDLKACGTIARAALPAAFCNAGMIVQATASHALKPGLRLRLWVWLARPLGDAELKCWLREAPVDRSLFSPTQLHYTAAPMFAAGLRDPLVKRLAWLPGDLAVEPPPDEEIRPPPLAKRVPPAFTSTDAAKPYVRSELTAVYQAISAAPDGERHNALVRGCARTVGLVHTGWLDEAQWRDVLTAGVRQAAPDCDQHKIDSALNWAIQAIPAPGSEFDHVQ